MKTESENEKKIYWAQHEPTENPLASAVTRLIQGIYSHHEQEPLLARKILRNRIYTNSEISPLERAMVKVAAKRIAHGSWEGISGGEESIDLSQAIPPSYSLPADQNRVGSLISSSEAMRFLKEWKDLAPRSKRRFENPRAVAALLTNSGGKVLGQALNTNACNKTLHAEINLIQEFIQRLNQGNDQASNPIAIHPIDRRLIPKGSVLYLTLQSCRMCAEYFIQASEDWKTNRVFYLEKDPGPMAQNTSIASIESQWN